MTEPRKATEIRIESYSVDCPYCGESYDDIYGDPRRMSPEDPLFDCEACDRSFDIPEDIELVFD